MYICILYNVYGSYTQLTAPFSRLKNYFVDYNIFRKNAMSSTGILYVSTTRKIVILYGILPSFIGRITERSIM